MLFNPDVVNEVDVPLPITVPPPSVLPVLYTVPFAGLADNELTVLLTTRYSSAPDAVNEPDILLLVTLLNERPIGCAAGVVHAGKVVAWLPVRGFVERYFGAPVQLVLLYAKTKK